MIKESLFPNNKRLQPGKCFGFLKNNDPLFSILPLQTIAYVFVQATVKFLADHQYECWFFWYSVQLWTTAKCR